jgi:hypothetical protein
MAKRNWLDKQLDHASSVVRSWSEWKRDTIRSQIADVGASGSSGSRNPSHETDGRDRGDGNGRSAAVRRY